MARIKTGSIVGDITGKVGDQIYSRNKYGPYVKTFVAPSISSSYADDARAKLAAAQADLALQDDNDWLVWSNFIRQYSKRPSFHNGYRFIDPKSMFVGCSINLQTFELGPTPLPVHPLSITDFDFTIESPDTDTLNFEFFGSGLDFNYGVLLKGSAPKPLSFRSVNSFPLYNFYWDNWNPESPINLAGDYLSRFVNNPPSASQRAWFEALVVHLESGLVISRRLKQLVGQGFNLPFFIGDQTVYASVSTVSNQAAKPSTSPANGNLLSISFYLDNATADYQFGIYDDSGGVPGNLLGSTNVFSLSGFTGWAKRDLTSPVAVSASQVLWIAIASSGQRRNRFQAGSTAVSISSTSGVNLPASWTQSNSTTSDASSFAEGIQS